MRNVMSKKKETRTALRKWKNQQIIREEFLKIGERYRSKRKTEKSK